MNCSELYLPLALGVPFVASLLLLVLGRRLPSALQTLAAGAGFLVPAALAVAAWAQFSCAMDPETGYAYLVNLPLGLESVGIALTLGVNGVSLPLFALAGIVGAAAGLQAMTGEAENKPVYLGLLLFMVSGLLGVFASVDIFFFYFFHEFALIPTFILMLYWGGLGRKVAAIQMAVYLTLGAMVSLAGIMLLVLWSGAGSFNLLELKAALLAMPMEEGAQAVVFGLLLLGFGILVSLFPFHSWAPDAYTEAPTPVSMLHAGVLKKFGLYGLIQLGALLLPAGLAHWAPVLFWLALGNILLIGFVTMSQRHLKAMLSYSSVMHMGPCFLGIFAFALSGGDTAGLGAAVVMMFAHGLSVALLFALSHAIYRRTGTLEFAENGGLAKYAPVLGGFFVAATMASIGLPGFANFWGELGIFVSLGQLPAWKLALVVSSIVISAIYGLRAVAAIFFGSASENTASRGEKIRDISHAERLVAVVLLTALVAVGFYPRLVSDSLDAALPKDFPPVAVDGLRLCPHCDGTHATVGEHPEHP